MGPGRTCNAAHWGSGEVGPLFGHGSLGEKGFKQVVKGITTGGAIRRVVTGSATH